MKLGPVTSKKFDNDVILENCDVIVIFLMYGQFRAIWKLDSRCRVCKIYVSVKNNLLSENRTKKSLTQLSHFWFE